LQRGGVKVVANEGEPAARIEALTKERMAQHTENYATAMSAVLREHPDLAEAQRATAPSVAAGGN
jgi:2-oxo-4-hydroxy-4-carboxy--5-ureidoimidazoline (OHCU) decarboxylase